MWPSRFLRPPGAPPRIYGHRGVRGTIPENTLAAFEQAIYEGADGIELDTRLCGSGELVVFHDPDLARVTGGQDNRWVHLVPYHELARIELGQNQRIPRLAEVLAWARGRRILVNVEVKGNPGPHLRLARAVQRALAAVPQGERYLQVSSFHPQILVALRALGCPLLLGFLFHEGQRRWHPWQVGSVVGVGALHPERTMCFPWAIQHAQAARKIINVWTVNDEREARDLAALGVDGLITDQPGRIRNAVERSTR
ncbi:MAG: glycerophosphodiester phosphodiesterase [Myxococcales bacterium]|nr:glycerophosphodiester phosphodiesterase [Polyangiaceae bacterium]MDW8249033.1 glycerophosphodiester phosphodiesterase [Myxococcales bacterium]